ncbi:replicative DNA helicase [Streptomyces sp. XY431]|uniref:replicative DNA helicase n=1 Tax=Streptomyces sp. XY431 TaxID=1415562 RepID=UPI0006AEAD55|nr:replicative DNA helicase [Streptomyces sp. XY431]
MSGHEQAAELPVIAAEVPRNLEAEQAVLGMMMRSKDFIAEAVEAIRPADYYRPAHELIHCAVLDLYAAHEPVDPFTVAAKLTERGELVRCGGVNYLHSLVNNARSIAHAARMLGRVRETALRRRLTEAGLRIDELAQSETPIDDVVAAAVAEVFAATDQDPTATVANLADVMEGALDEIEAIGTVGSPSGIPTGFHELDQMTGGLRPGQLVVIASRPAMGKSTLALDVARSCAIHHKLPALLFTPEIGRNEVAMRLLAAEARVPLHLLRSSNMTDDDWTRVARRMPDVSEAPLFIDDSPKLTFTEIQAKCRRLRQRNDIRLAVVDYVQLLDYGLRRFQSRYEEINEISRHLKILARELEIPIVLLSQLNRGPEHRIDKRPQLFDMRDSGTLEDDADLVIMLHREDAYEKVSPRAGEADLIVAKHRGGITGTITIAFQGHYSRFVDMVRERSLPEQQHGEADEPTEPARPTE